MLIRSLRWRRKE